MIQRFDQLAVDLPEPSGPNAAAAAAIQELMGGKFGEMSTLMNYTFQSFNFLGKEKYRIDRSTILSATSRPRNTATSRQ